LEAGSDTSVNAHGLLLIKEWRFSSPIERPSTPEPVPGTPIARPPAAPPNRDDERP
jgi:hypothetical protein